MRMTRVLTLPADRGADLRGSWGTVSWDDVVARNPEVVVLGIRNIAAVRKLAESLYPEKFK